MWTNEQFLRQLRSDLNHLYDPDHLRKSPLAALFDVADRFDTSSRLQHILTRAIESLEPKANEPTHSQAWSVYEHLFYRYVQQLKQQEIADQLGMCTRHVRRKHRAALEVLVTLLWEQYDLETKLEGGGPAPEAVTAIPAAVDRGTPDGPDVNEELAWLKDAPPEGTTNLGQTLRTVIDRLEPLTARYGTDLAVATDSAFPSLAVHPVALTQTLLNLLSVAIHRAPGGQVVVSAESLGHEVRLYVRCAGAVSEHRSLSDDVASLDMARRLVSLCGCKLSVLTTAGNGSFEAVLAVPTCQELPVLVIDDNADTLSLLQRYASDTRYRVIGVQDPSRALHLAETHAPHVIVLDVMMPQVDGWEVLARLRQSPITRHIPIVVCTILTQEEFARSLGAHDFLRKPITRQAFLAALERQVTPMSPGSR